MDRFGVASRISLREAAVVVCKRCASDLIVKNGFVRGKQRYRCKKCELNFVEGDDRTNEKIIAKKALCVLLYSLGKVSFNMLAKIFDTWPPLTYRWVMEAGAGLPEYNISNKIREMEFDEMWHFIDSKKASAGSSKPLTVAHGKLWHGCSAIVILLHSDVFTTR